MAERAAVSTWRDYEYHELTDNSPVISGDSQAGLRFERTYEIQPGDRDTVNGFIAAILGSVDIKSNGGGSSGYNPGSYTRLSPHRILVAEDVPIWRPWSPDQNLSYDRRYAYATDILSVRFAGPKKQLKYTDESIGHDQADLYWPESSSAFCTFLYQTLRFEHADDGVGLRGNSTAELHRCVSRDSQPAVQYAERPGEYVKFELTAVEAATPNKSPVPFNTGFGFPVGMADWTYTWHRCLFPPHSAKFLLGRVNGPEDPLNSDYHKKPTDQHTFAEMWDGQFPPYTLLFLGYSFQEYTSGNGQILYDVSYRFRQVPRGHIYVYRHELGKSPPDSSLPGWMRVSSSGQPFTYLKDLYNNPLHKDTYKTRLPFQTADFNDLFRPYLNDYPPARHASWDII